jgi:capsular polysaccharide biosynthesis protein
VTAVEPGSPTGDLIRSLVRHGWLFALALVPAALLLVNPPSTAAGFVGSTTVAVHPPPDATLGERKLFSAWVSRHIESFAVVATTPSVLDDVIASTGVETSVTQLARSITVTSADNRQVVSLEVSGDDRATTQQLADALGEALAERIEALAPEDRRSGTLVGARHQGATVSEVPAEGSLLLAALAALLGLVAAGAWVLLRFATDDVVRRPGDLASITRAPVLATFREQRSDPHETDLLRLHLTSRRLGSTGQTRLVGTTARADEAFDARTRLLRSFGSSHEATPHVEVIAPDRVAALAHAGERSSLATEPAPVVVVVALGRVTGTELVALLHAVENLGGVVGGVVLHRSRPRWRRWLPERRTETP